MNDFTKRIIMKTNITKELMLLKKSLVELSVIRIYENNKDEIVTS